MRKLLCEERHFTDVFGSYVALNGGESKLHHSSSVCKLKRMPKCKTKNVDSCLQTIDESCSSDTQLLRPESTASTADEFTDSSDEDRLELADMQASRFTNTHLWKLECLPFFDILCSGLQSSETVTTHQAARLSRWLSHRQTVQTANSSLMQIMMASKCPLVSLICCRILKQLHLIPSVRLFTLQPNAVSTLAKTDIILNVLLLQKELVKFLETGRFSMDLLNAICVLDCITAVCHDVAECKLRVGSQFRSRWSSSELRWGVLAVASLATAISAKINLTSVISHSDLNNSAHSVGLQVARVPRIANTILAMSVQCEVAQVANIHRIMNEYWHTSDFYQRRLIAESVLVPKLQFELCIVILAGHCDVSLSGFFASLPSLDNIFDVFGESLVISAITQRVWMDDSSSVISHCQEICVILCIAVCSYIRHRIGELGVC